MFLHYMAGRGLISRMTTRLTWIDPAQESRILDCPTNRQHVDQFAFHSLHNLHRRSVSITTRRYYFKLHTVLL